MTEEITSLYMDLNGSYHDALNNDKRLMMLAQKLKDGRGTQADVNELTARVNKHSSDAMKQVLTIDRLPDGKVSEEVANQVIKPHLDQVYSAINKAAALQQRTQDIAHGVNVAVQAGSDSGRHIQKVLEAAMKSETAEQLANAFTLEAGAAGLDFLSDFQMRNAEIRSNLGLPQVVVRTYDGVGLDSGDCKWCLKRAGTWKYPDAVANGVFAHHPGCNCKVETFYEDGYKLEQTDWRHNVWEPEP